MVLHEFFPEKRATHFGGLLTTVAVQWTHFGALSEILCALANFALLLPGGGLLVLLFANFALLLPASSWVVDAWL